MGMHLATLILPMALVAEPMAPMIEFSVAPSMQMGGGEEKNPTAVVLNPLLTLRFAVPIAGFSRDAAVDAPVPVVPPAAAGGAGAASSPTPVRKSRVPYASDWTLGLLVPFRGGPGFGMAAGARIRR